MKNLHVVRATGEASVSAKPDRAEISIGVVTQAATAEAASTQNATQTTEVINALKQALGSEGEITTQGYAITPQQEYREGHAPKTTAYQATNTVQVRINDLSLVGKIIDTATRAGANDINNISFTLRNDEAVRAQALAQAATKARANAEAIARALNLHVIGVLDAQTTEAPIFRPVSATLGAAKARAATPIETGTLDITATVTVTLQVQ